jgi:multidrug efflux pump subunit AcrB
MSLVAFALRRPISLIVLVIAVALTGLYAFQRMPKDIFPDLGVPVLYVAQPYGGMDPAKMEGYLTYYYEYHFLYLTGIEHVESKSIQGVALIKLQFHPGTNMAQALAETISYANRARAFMPEGTVPPFVMRFDAGSVPVGDLVFSSKTRTVAELQDAALNRVRPLFATLPGVSAPPPFGASQRTVVIRADPDKLRAYNMSPDELARAVSVGNIVMPSGNVQIGDTLPMVPTNSVVSNVKDMNNIAVRSRGIQTVFLRDVATVEDSSDIQTGYALVNGRPTVYIPVTKRADASTLSVVQLVRENLPKFRAVLPDDMEVQYQFDQSPYVARAIEGLAIEGALGAMLTGVMVLLFLRDWRSSLIVVVNIPLSILGAALALWLTGATVNIMTLGGLALAVGILVDETTVTIENIHTHLGRGSSLARAARDATAETVVARFLSMLCILAIFTPALFMTGAARNLFLPLALAVGFAQVTSYVLSSTLVPVLSVWILEPDNHKQDKQDTHFDRLHRRYEALNRSVICRRWLFPAYLIVTGLIIVGVGSLLGSEIFPTVDTGQFELRLRAPAGTRIDRTRRIALQTLDAIKRDVGADNVEITLSFIGVPPPNYPINTIYLWTSGPEEAVLQVQLKSDSGVRIADLQEHLRVSLPEEMPGVRFSFEPSDIVSRVMSFGAAKPIEVDISGPSLADDRAYAEKVRGALSHIAELRDLGYEQELDYPTIAVDLDRERAGVLGVTTSDVARAVVSGTSSSRYISANYWADPNSGVGYQVQVEIPEQRMNSLEQLRNLPVANRPDGQIDLRDLASVTEGTRPGEYDRYNSVRTVTLGANVFGETLGAAARQVDRALKGAGNPPAKVNVSVRGQVVPMRDMFDGLRTGFLVAVGVILLLLAFNYQSFRLAVAVVLTIPAVAAGVAVALWVTGTTLNIQSLMGTIMAIGVAVANAILLVTFAERGRIEGASAEEAALSGAASRFRPILMTSLAMIAGMLPMALGIGGGGDQSAPLGRAVIGGLIGATIATLLVLPAIFVAIQRHRSRESASLDCDDPGSRYFESQPANAARHAPAATTSGGQP